jgi:hypothetical protein
LKGIQQSLALFGKLPTFFTNLGGFACITTFTSSSNGCRRLYYWPKQVLGFGAGLHQEPTFGGWFVLWHQSPGKLCFFERRLIMCIAFRTLVYLIAEERFQRVLV